MQPIAPDTLLQQRYRILNLLEEGEFGRTYLAIDLSHGEEQRAIDEFIPSTQFPTTISKAKEIFKQEAILLYQLQHPQIPHFRATFEEQNRLFLVRDYVEGKTYAQLLDERRDVGTVFSEAEVWKLLLQVLPVIAYIHSKGIVHHNISPASIILSQRDRLPVLSDFGAVTEFAKQLHANSAQQNQSIGGKPGYAPSEQLQNGQVYANSDLYALAVTAIVLLTGKEPSALFTGDRVNWDWREWTQIGDDFAAVLGRMLSPQPQDRYQSATEAERALQSLNISPPTTVAKPQHFSELPTMAVGDKGNPSVTNRVQSALTNLNVKSVWEKPQVFIPLGLLIAALAGLGSWMGVTHLLHRQPSTPVASEPPKQIDFNNPTIPTESTSPNGTNAEIIKPELDRAVIKEGTVDEDKPMRYQIAAVSGQNLDIQLVPAGANTSAIPAQPIDPTQPSPNPTGAVSPLAPIPTKSTPAKLPKTPANNSPVPTVTPLAATQVLMSILSPTGSPIDEKADRVVGWRGQVISSGDYTIELRPIKGLAGKAFPYKLSVTQLATTPSPLPGDAGKSPADTPPLGAPIPIGGNGLDPIPASPKPNLPAPNTPSNIPTVTPAPIPIEAPTTRPRKNTTESEQPTRPRRRARTEAETTTPVRERRRSRSNEAETPTPRRSRIESSEEANPTPRRRTRNRSTTVETQPKPAPSKAPENENTEGNNSPEVPGETIVVPSPKNNSVPSSTPNNDSTAPPSRSGAIDPD